LEKIELLFKSFEQAGLYQGNILFTGKEYIFRDGDCTVNLKPGNASLKEDIVEEVRPDDLEEDFDNKENPGKRIFQVAAVLIVVIASLYFIINPGKKSNPPRINETGKSEIIPDKKEKERDAEVKQEKIVEPEKELKDTVVEPAENTVEKKVKEKQDEDKGAKVNKQPVEDKEKKVSAPDINKKEQVTVKAKPEAGVSKKIKEQKSAEAIKKQKENEKKTTTTRIRPKHTLPGSKRIQEVQISKLPAGYRNEYMEMLHKIRISGFKKNITVEGQISVTLGIDKKGIISIANYKDKIKVSKNNMRYAIKKMICAGIKSLSLSPPQDSMGKAVNVGNFKATYSIGVHKGDLILRREY
jgi:hypothetical protein